MQSNRALYDSIWKNVQAEKLESIKQLDAFVKHLNKVAANHECRQFNRIRIGTNRNETKEHIHQVLCNQNVCDAGDLAVPLPAPTDLTDDHSSPTAGQGPAQGDPAHQLSWVVAHAAESSPPHHADSAAHALLVNTLHPVASQLHIQNFLFNQSAIFVHDMAVNEVVAVPPRQSQHRPYGDEENTRATRPNLATLLSAWKSQVIMTMSCSF